MEWRIGGFEMELSVCEAAAAKRRDKVGAVVL